MELIAETTFLIGIWRRQEWAQSFAAKNISRTFGIPWIVLGEFWHGAIKAQHDEIKVRKFLSIGLPLLDSTQVVPAYAKMCAGLQNKSFYRGIGQNDLWIAATCLAFDKPLVTRNKRHFDKIDGLKLEVVDNTG